jgi:chromosome partitioning protein
MIIAISAQKGGVGKTSLTFHLSGAFAQGGYKTLLIDTDPQHSLSATFIEDVYQSKNTLRELLTNPSLQACDVIQETKFQNLHILPCNLSLGLEEMTLLSDPDSQYALQTKLSGIRDNYGIVLVDTPPNLGIFPRIALVAADYVIIPVECNSYAVRTTQFLLELIIKVRKKANPALKVLGFVINKLNTTRTIEQKYLETLRKKYGPNVFRTEIRNSVRYLEATTMKTPITHYQPRSEQAETIRQLRNEIAPYLAKPAKERTAQ